MPKERHEISWLNVSIPDSGMQAVGMRDDRPLRGDDRPRDDRPRDDRPLG